MALPEHCLDPTAYFEECFQFFIDYEYLYNLPNTELLLNNTLDQIDVDGLENHDIFDKNVDPCNDYLNRFFEKLNRLKIHRIKFEEDESLDFVVEAPLSEKKKHEIVYLAKEIGTVCKEEQCETVVDFGSGLGYLDQQIYNTSKLNVLGIECNENNYVGAKKRQRKYYLDSIDNVKYIKHTVTEKSCDKIEECLINKFKKKQTFCIAGLHACADLTVDALNLFFKMEDARALIVMPCCYHKLIQTDTGFKNFPLSQCLKEIYSKYSGYKYLKVPFLRLAAQPSVIDGESMEGLVFSLLARATLQVYANQCKCTLKRKKRKAVKLKTKNNDFEAYIKDAVNGFSLIPSENLQQNCHLFDEMELSELWRQNSPLTFKKTAIFVILQNAMQPVFENFIMFDRVLYLKENGVEKCELKRIVDERISPRCFALIAKK